MTIITICRPPSRHLLAWCAAAFALNTAQAQPLSEPPAGLVPADRLRQTEAELKKARADLQSAEARLKEATSKRAPDPDTAPRLQQAQAELGEARKRMALLESQLRNAERQRDEARAAAQRAQAGARTTAEPDPGLRNERDRLRRELASAVGEKDRLQGELLIAQRAVQALQAAAAKAPAAAVPSGVPATATAASPAVAERPAPKQALVDGQELSVPGCGAACPTFIVLPQVGRVTMGTGSDARTVDFKHRIGMGKTEVTVAQWKHFMADSAYRLPPNNTTYCDWQKEAVSDQHPVRCVSAEDADAYASWFQKKYAVQVHAAIRQLGLPSADEWEYAARAGRWTQERQWDGGQENCSLAASFGCTSNSPDPVAKKGRLANAWGLYDTIGNVWEWMSPSDPGGGLRGLRGGSFSINSDFLNLRLSLRNAYAPSRRGNDIGFRLLARIDL
jgi:formylglycine-generating enzyme required for sulfatase activity